jgi:hypothetical protein
MILIYINITVKIHFLIFHVLGLGVFEKMSGATQDAKDCESLYRVTFLTRELLQPWREAAD